MGWNLVPKGISVQLAPAPLHVRLDYSACPSNTIRHSDTAVSWYLGSMPEIALAIQAEYLGFRSKPVNVGVLRHPKTEPSFLFTSAVARNQRRPTEPTTSASSVAYRERGAIQ